MPCSGLSWTRGGEDQEVAHVVRDGSQDVALGFLRQVLDDFQAENEICLSSEADWIPHVLDMDDYLWGNILKGDRVKLDSVDLGSYIMKRLEPPAISGAKVNHGSRATVFSDPPASHLFDPVMLPLEGLEPFGGSVVAIVIKGHLPAFPDRTCTNLEC